MENNEYDFGFDGDLSINDVFDDVENSTEDFTDENQNVDDNDQSEDVDDFETEDEQIEEKEEVINTSNKEKSKPQPKTKKTVEKSIYTDVYKDLKEYGILKHSEIGEDEDLDADRLAEIYEQDYEQEVKNRVKQWANETLDEEAQAFLKFKEAGGNTRDFVKYMALEENYIPSGDIEDEEFQDEIIRLQLANEGLPTDEIEDELEYLTERGRKESTAKKYYKKLKAENDKKREEFIKQQEALYQKQEEERLQFSKNIVQTINSKAEVNGFKLNKKDKENLIPFLTKRSVKVGENQYITPFQVNLAKALQDTDKVVIIAKLLANNFDMSDYDKSLITKETRKIKSNLEHRKGLTKSNSGSSTKGLNLSDLFDD